MKRFTLFLFFYRVVAQIESDFFDQEKCVIDNRSLDNMWEYKLRHDLKQCYERYKPPDINGTEPLVVNLHIFIKSYKYNTNNQVFSASTWTVLTWEDPRLTWDPKKYDGIDSIVISTRSGLWIPGIKLINSIYEDYYELRYFFPPCDADQHGILTCIIQIGLEVQCFADLRQWPYDAQYCKLEYGISPEALTSTKMQLDIGSRAMIAIEDKGEWIIKDTEQILDETSEKQVILKFRLERYTEGIAAIVIYPSILLSILTISSLLMDVRFNNRLLVMCFSLMSQFYLLKDVAWEFPENIKDPPNLLMYYRGSLILTSLLIIEHLILNYICSKDVACYSWIISVNEFVFEKVKIIWPRWESKNEDHVHKDWTDFANIINIISMLVSVIVYVSLFCAFIPQPTSFDDD